MERENQFVQASGPLSKVEQPSGWQVKHQVWQVWVKSPPTTPYRFGSARRCRVSRLRFNFFTVFFKETSFGIVQSTV